METKRFAGVVCRDLRSFIDCGGVPMGDLGWGISGTRVSSRLKHRDPAPNLDHVDATLDTLEIDLDEFLLGLATGFHPKLVLAPYLDEHPRQFPRFRRRRLRQPPKRDYSAAEIHEMAGGLESLRFRDAGAAFRQALEILRSGAVGGAVEPDDAAESWGVLGVIQRHRGHISTAAGGFLEALDLGEAPAVRARTFQRIGMLLHLNGDDQDLALRAILRARGIYLDAGDDSGVGKTFVDEAAIAGFCGGYRRARALNRRALRYLQDNDIENRFAAIQGIAVASVFLEETDEAATFLHQAATTLPGDRPLLSCSLDWLQGELALDLGQSLEALDHLRAALDAAEEAGLAPVELVLLQLRIAKAHRLQGDRKALLWTLYDIMDLRRSFRGSKPVGAVLSEFLTVALEEDAAGVTVELLEETYRKMRDGATLHAAPSLPSR